MGKDKLQIWWTGDRATVEEIEFFLADKEQKILARQIKIAPPYEATFKRHKRMEFIGVTLTHTDGTKRSILIPKRLLTPQAQPQLLPRTSLFAYRG